MNFFLIQSLISNFNFAVCCNSITTITTSKLFNSLILCLFVLLILSEFLKESILNYLLSLYFRLLRFWLLIICFIDLMSFQVLVVFYCQTYFHSEFLLLQVIELDLSAFTKLSLKSFQLENFLGDLLVH